MKLYIIRKIEDAYDSAGSSRPSDYSVGNAIGRIILFIAGIKIGSWIAPFFAAIILKIMGLG